MLFGLKPFYLHTTDRDKRIIRFVRHISGYWPRGLGVYRLAFTHISKVENPSKAAMLCNERLEFLGDSILGSVIAEYLFKKYSIKDEGFLTEMRAKIVNRSRLNEIGLKLGMDEILDYDRAGNWLNRSIFGNTVEAFIGALYLDQGYRRTKRFIIQRMLSFYINLEKLAEQNLNYKSQLMEFVQKNKLDDVTYELVEERANGKRREFTVAVKIGEEILGIGTDTKKKFAEQKASGEALLKLKVIEELEPVSPRIQ